MASRDTATTLPSKALRYDRNRPRQGWPACRGERHAREGLVAGGLCCDTNGCIVTGKWFGCWVVSQDRRDTATGSTTIRRRGYATQCLARRYGARHGAPACAWAQRHSRAKPATRPGQACDMAQCAHRLGQGWVHCARDLVLTQCTVLSHCLGHYS